MTTGNCDATKIAILVKIINSAVRADVRMVKVKNFRLGAIVDQIDENEFR